MVDAVFNLEASILGQFGRVGAADGIISSLSSNSKETILTLVSPSKPAGREPNNGGARRGGGPVGGGERAM